jgi:hypothetical protein
VPVAHARNLEPALAGEDRDADNPAVGGLGSDVATGDLSRRPQAETPFAWQHGRRLLLLDEEPSGWTFAELRFDEARCRYVEVRRATFRWPREAAGVLVARGLVFGKEPAERLAVALDRWLTLHVAAGVPQDLVDPQGARSES